MRILHTDEARQIPDWLNDLLASNVGYTPIGSGQKMIYRLTADLVVLIHLAFILFAALGGLLVLKYRRCALLHLPALVWAVLISLANWVCPLTPLENWLRERGGLLGYETSFILWRS